MLHILFQATDADRVYIYKYMALSGYGEPTWYACLDPQKTKDLLLSESNHPI